MVWLYKYLRDAVDFEWLIDAADRNPGRYTAAETLKAKHVLHMLKLRLVYAAEATFLYMVDSEPYDDMPFPGYKEAFASASQYWKQGMQTFTCSEAWHIQLEEWPVRVDLQYRKKRLATIAAPGAISEALAIT